MTQTPRRIDARVGHTRISKGPVRGPIPLHAFIMKIDGQERLIKKAWGVESADSRRILSGRHNVLVMLDLAEMQGTEDWYGYEMPPEEARKLGASLLAIADEIDAMNAPAAAPKKPDIRAYCPTDGQTVALMDGSCITCGGATWESQEEYEAMQEDPTPDIGIVE